MAEVKAAAPTPDDPPVPGVAPLKTDIEAAAQAPPVQAPAIYLFEAREGRIAAANPESRPSDEGMAGYLLAEVRRKAEALAARLAASNAPPRILRSTRDLLEVLPERVSDLRPGLLRSRVRSLEADAAAYTVAEGELFPDAVSMLVDTVETTRDLLGCYSEVRKVENETQAQGLLPEDVEAVRATLDAMTGEAGKAKEVVHSSAATALVSMSTFAAAEVTDPEERRLRVAEYAVVQRNFASKMLSLSVIEVFDQRVASEGTEVEREVWKKAREKIIDDRAADVATLFRYPGRFSLLMNLLSDPLASLIDRLQGYERLRTFFDLFDKWRPRQ